MRCLAAFLYHRSLILWTRDPDTPSLLPLLVQSREGMFHTVLPPHTVYLTPDRVSLKLFWGIRLLRNFFSNYQKLIDRKHVDSLEPQRGTAGGRGEGGEALDSGSQPGPPTWHMSWAVMAMALKGLRVIDNMRSFSFFFF